MKKSKEKQTGKKIRRFLQDESGEFGLNTVIGVAIGLIVAAFVVLPGIRSFADLVMDHMSLWWETSVHGTIFGRN